MICTKCLLEKNENEFYFKNKAVGRRDTQCKSCVNAYRKEHYRKNSDVYKARSRRQDLQYKKRNVTNILEYLKTHPCVGCGESDPLVLEFDHRDMETKTHNISKMIAIFSWDKIEKEILKCDVRCANCHKRKTVKQLGHLRYLLTNRE